MNLRNILVMFISINWQAEQYAVALLKIADKLKNSANNDLKINMGNRESLCERVILASRNETLKVAGVHKKKKKSHSQLYVVCSRVSNES